MARKKIVKKTARKKSKSTARSSGKASAGNRAKKAAKPAVKKKVAKKTAGKKAVKKHSVKAPAKPASAARAVKKKKKAKIKSPLNKKQLQQFRALLMEKRRSLIGDMSGIEAGALGRNLQESAGNLSTMPTHPADIGSDNFEHEFTLGLLESEQALLTEIHRALERIDAGTFGVCMGTGSAIGLPRLKARPWCKYCIEYQKMIEKGLVRDGENDNYGMDEEEE